MNFRQSVIITELWRPEFARRWKNVFCKNDPLLEIFFQNSVPKDLIATPIDVLYSNFAHIVLIWLQNIKSRICSRLDLIVLRHRTRKFGEVTQNNGHYAVQGHSSPIVVPIESSYTTSY